MGHNFAGVTPDATALKATRVPLAPKLFPSNKN